MVVAVFILFASLCFGQQLTGTLSGTTVDATGAVVPNANVVMTNEASGDTRTTVSNGSGYFSITAIRPGSYTITVSAPGFKTWKQARIAFAQGDSRSLPNIKLEVGQVSETIEITAGADAVVPMDTGEVSTTLNTRMVQELAIAGRDAGELLKLMPGMALTNGLQQGSSFNTKTVGTNTGPVGSYSSNGTQPNGSMAFMLDGANLVDPGNAGTQIANINQDMTAEVKVLMSSYSAEYAKGPVIFQAFSKSGGRNFHGEGYLYARNSALNAIDAFTHEQIAIGATTAAQAAPDESFYYAGGNFGGPIRLPFTGFNKDRNKLFFWVGYEYMRQHPAGSILNMNVPTMNQRAGDFTNSDLTPAQLAGVMGPFSYAYQSMFNQPANSTSTHIADADRDPNIAGILGLYPKPNISPSSGNGWNNYQFVQQTPQNRWELTGKVDYAITDNTKLTVSYSRQIENDQHPVAIWWAPNWTLPYPSPITAATVSQTLMSNFTHVFSPTTTNEFVFTYARYINPSTLSNPDAVDRSKLGFNVSGLFGHTSKQMPNIYGPWGGAFPDWRMQSFDGGFGGGSAFGATKRDPAFYDNFTKVVGSHTLKAGFYWDSNGNIQSNGGNDNGIYNMGWGSNSTGNVVADFLIGRTANYQQTSSVPVQTLQFHQWSIYAQDSFKANKQLTLNYGLRADHMGQWYGGGPNGFQVWDPASYVNGTRSPGGANLHTGDNTGLLWHALNSKIPLSGFQSPLFYYEPRAGLAYDLFGNGRTVVRSGFAVFRYQFAENDVLASAGGPAGIFTYQSASTTGWTGAANSGFAQIQSGGSGFTPPSAVAQNGADGVQVMQQGDNKTPRVMNWNVTLSQSLPWRSVLEVSYVANKSTGQLINGNNDRLGDLNSAAPGAFFQMDQMLGHNISSGNLPCGQSNPGNNAVDCAGTNFGTSNATIYTSTFSGHDYHPLTNYNNLYLISHGGYASYNSMQVSWQKQSGPITFLTNYTFGKVLGTRDGQTNNGAGNGRAVDPYSIKNNYGPLGYDHTHILNLSYVWNLPKLIRSSGFADTMINGWQLSGYTTFTVGAPIQPNTGGNLNATFTGSALTVPLVGAPDLPDNSILLPNGLKSNQVNTGTWMGVNADAGGYQVLVPALTCDPRKHASGQYFNPNCFTTPAYGTQGQFVWPYLRGPGYFNSDLSLYKNFKITENQKLQFRLSATNFLNRPNQQFNLTGGNNDVRLDFTRHYTVPLDNSKFGSCTFLNLAVDANGFCQAPVVGLSPTNTNATTNGTPQFKGSTSGTSARTLTFAIKYFF